MVVSHHHHQDHGLTINNIHSYATKHPPMTVLRHPELNQQIFSKSNRIRMLIWFVCDIIILLETKRNPTSSCTQAEHSTSAAPRHPLTSDYICHRPDSRESTPPARSACTLPLPCAKSSGHEAAQCLLESGARSSSRTVAAAARHPIIHALVTVC